MVLTARPLFSPAWQARYAPVTERAMVAAIAIYEVVGEPVWDPITDTWDAETTTWYTGKARVQPVRAAYRVDAAGDSKDVQRTLFSIPISSIALELRTGLQVAVTASTLNPSLLTYSFVVSEVLDSSNPIEKTFHCTSNLETVV